MERSPHLVRPACPFTARACGPFLFRRFAPLAASGAYCPPAARPPVAVITARGAPPKPAGSPPRPACGPVRPFPSLCPSKPATARRGASLARPVTAPARGSPPACPPRPAEARRGVSARPPPPKPATGRGSPLPPVRRPASPPCPPAVRLPLARRPPWRGDHRPPPPGCAPPVCRPVKNLLKNLIASFLHLEIRVKTHFYNWDSYRGRTGFFGFFHILKKFFWRG
jgi:hypothetical protein